jgi:beta-carotene 3-hydroxylase
MILCYDLLYMRFGINDILESKIEFINFTCAVMINFILLILAYFFMEFVAWSNHKFAMHGFLWKWHNDHHINDQKKVAMEEMKFSGFEKNDYFFLVFAIPAILMTLSGFYYDYLSLIFIGIGITLYGLTYFLVHDVIIHQRIQIPFLRKNHNIYTKAIINAHLAHHRPKSASDFQNFGLLIFPIRFFKK